MARFTGGQEPAEERDELTRPDRTQERDELTRPDRTQERDELTRPDPA